MSRAAVIGLCALLGAWFGLPRDGHGADAPPRFAVWDVYADSGTLPLAAWQLEFHAETPGVRIVGIEGGEHPAFREPPFYDPRALQKDQVVLASFHIGGTDELPVGRSRIATLHLQLRHPGKPDLRFKLHTAAGPDGKPISITLSLNERKPR